MFSSYIRKIEQKAKVLSYIWAVGMVEWYGLTKVAVAMFPSKQADLSPPPDLSALWLAVVCYPAVLWWFYGKRGKCQIQLDTNGMIEQFGDRVVKSYFRLIRKLA